MTTHKISISIKVLTSGISIDINTASPQTTNDTIKTETLKLDDYEGLKKLLPLYDDNIITYTDRADITADVNTEETIVIEDNDDESVDEDDEQTIATDDSEDEDGDGEDEDEDGEDEDEDDKETDDEETDDEETDEGIHISKISRLN